MSLQNQPGMFQGEAALNPLPYVNIAMQARARKAAREEAIDKYYQKLPDTINDKGVRDQEIPIINEFKNKIFEFGVKNREALRNPKVDNGAAQLNLDKLMREAASIARLSQNAAKADLNAGKFFLNKDNQYALNNDEYIADNELHNLPVTDPRHKTLDLEKFAANRPFNESAFVKDVKAKFPYSEKVVREADPTDPNYEIVTTLPVLDEKAKIQMVADAADRFHNDPTFRKKISKDLAGTGQLQDMIQIAKDVFGVPQEELDDEMLAAAYTYSKLPIGKTKEKVQASYTNREAGKMKDWKIKEDIRQANRRELFGMREAAKAAGEEAEDLWIETFIDRLGKDAENSTTKSVYIKGGNRIVENSIPVDAVTAKIFTRDGLSPDKLTVTSEGTYRPIFYKRDADGVAIKEGNEFVVDETSSVPISKDQFKLLLGGKAGVKQLNKEMNKPGESNKSTTTKQTVPNF